MPRITISQEDLKKLQMTITTALLHSMRVNKYYPIDVAFSDLEYFGLSITTFLSYQGQHKIRLYIGSTRIQDRASRLMRKTTDYIELIRGIGEFQLEKPEYCTKDWIPSTWITVLGKLLHINGG